MGIYDKIEHHWRMVFEENYGGVDDQKSILHAKRWDVYTNKKKQLLEVGIMWKCQVLMGRRSFGGGRRSCC